MRKRVLSILIAALMVVSLLPAAAFAEAQMIGDSSVTWELKNENRELLIEGSGNMPDLSESNYPWQSNINNILNIDVFSDVTSIGSYAFYNINKAISVSLPSTLMSIGEHAFDTCEKLESITIPVDLTSIGDYSFKKCSSLKSITLPSKVTEIGNYAFDSCTSLSTVTCKATNPPTIGNNIFAGCNSLATIYVPESSVETYREVENWSNYQGKIQAIPQTIADILPDDFPKDDYDPWYNSNEDNVYIYLDEDNSKLIFDHTPFTAGVLISSVLTKAEKDPTWADTTTRRLEYSSDDIVIQFNMTGDAGDELENIVVTYCFYSGVKGTYAPSEETVSYTVTYDANGATSGTVPTDANKYGLEAVVPVKDNTGNLARDGYTFDGWNTKTDGTGTDYPVTSTFTITADTTLYAKWTSVGSHTHDDITFTPWESGNSLPSGAGNYYLDTDVTLSSTWNVPTSGITNLCLNGHVIKANCTDANKFSVITVPVNATLNLYDCGTTEHKGYIDADGLWHLAAGGHPAEGETEKNINGGVITGGNAINGGGGVHVEGTFSMNGGNIVGNMAGGTVNGGGVIVHTGATFTMNGGAITENVTPNGGGGVCCSSTFNMLKGKIANNKACAGGGVYIFSVDNSCINMSGGNITGNTASNNGGGVCYAGKGAVTLGGTAQITGNFKGTGEDAAENNLYLGSNKHITLGTKSGSEEGNGVAVPTSDMSVGVTIANGTGRFTTDASGADAAKDFFFSDKSDYEVKLNIGSDNTKNTDDYLELVTKPDWEVIDAQELVNIYTADGLFKFADSTKEDQAKKYSGYEIHIKNDIDITGRSWTTIDAWETWNGLTIDGENHTITGLGVPNALTEGNDPHNYGGAFITKVHGSTVVKDITFDKATVTAQNGSQVAVIIGMSYGDVTFDNVTISNSKIDTTTKAGAFLGQNDEGFVKLKNCSLVNTTVKAEYSFALMIGLLNENSKGAEFNSCSADTDSKIILADPEGETKFATINEYVFEIDGEKLWIHDPNGAWAEQRITSQKCKYNGTDYTVLGGKFYHADKVVMIPEVYPEPKPVAQIGNKGYEKFSDAVSDAKIATTTEGKTIKIVGTVDEAYSFAGDCSGITFLGSETGKVTKGWTVQGNQTNMSNITIDGVKFCEGGNIVFSTAASDYSGIKIQNCTFSGTGAASTPGIQIAVGDAPYAGIEIKNNTISDFSGESSTAILMNIPKDNTNSGTITIEGNKVTNFGHNGVQFIIATADLVIKDNQFTCTKTDKDVLNLSSANSVTLTGNTFAVPADYLTGNQIVWNNNAGVIVNATGNTFIKGETTLTDIKDLAAHIAGYANNKTFVGYGLTKDNDNKLNGGYLCSYNESTVFPTDLIAEGYKPVFTEKYGNVNVYQIKEKQFVAQISDEKYETLAEAIAAVPADNTKTVTIELLKDIVLTGSVDINKNNVVVDGKNFTISADSNYTDFAKYKVGGEKQKYGQYKLLAVSGNDVTVKNLTVDVKEYRGMSCLTTTGGKDVTYENVTYNGYGSGHYYGTSATSSGTITFKNCKFNTHGYAINMSEGTSAVVIDGCTIKGWSSFGSTLSSVTAKDSSFYGSTDMGANGLLAKFRPYGVTTITNCKFSEDYLANGDFCGIDSGAETVVNMKDCSVIKNDGTASDLKVYELINYKDNDANKATIFAIDVTGTVDGYTAGTFVTKTGTISLASKYKLKNITENVNQVVPFDMVAIPVGQNFVYNGNAKTGVKANDAYTLTETTSAISAGKYTATATLKDGYQWIDNTTGAKTITWEILKQSQSAPAKGVGYTISGTTLNAESGYELYNGTSTGSSFEIANNTSYFVRLKGDDNKFASPYTAIDTTVAINALVSPAGKGTVRVTGVTNGKCTIGTSVTVTATAGSGYKFVEWRNAAGEKIDGAAPTYQFNATSSITLTAVFEPDTQRTVVQIPVANNKTYDGNPITGVANGSGYTLSGTASATNAGTYAAIATLTNTTDYVWADGTTDAKSITWVIYKATQTAPENVVGGDNSITGVDASMEYMGKGGSTYTAISGTPISGLPAGTYYVRKVADDNHLASPAVAVTVKLPTITVATIQPSVLGENSATLNGSVTPYDSERITAVGFEYKLASASGWTSVTATEGALFNTEISDLTAGTKYVARAYAKTSTETIYGLETTFYTLAAAATGEIDVFLNKDTEREVTLTIEKGNAAIASVTFVGNTWKFNELEDGFYNIVVRTTDGDFTETRLVEVTGGKVVASSFSIPVGKIATVVEIKSENTPAVAVGGLSEILTVDEKNAAAIGAVDVEIKLEAQKEATTSSETASHDTTQYAVAQIEKLIPEATSTVKENIETVLDLSLIKTTTELENGEVKSVDIKNIGSENNTVIEIAIPYETAGKTLKVYRYHDGVAKELTLLSSRPSANFINGTYFVGNGYVFIYASEFSTYAISNEETKTVPSGGGGTGGRVSPKPVVPEFKNPFVDVFEKDYFYDPVLWAAENKITAGTDATHFSPSGTTTRGQMITFLWRMAGSPVFEDDDIKFSDIKKTDYFYNAVVWGWNMGIVSGKSASKFAPDDKVTRGEAVTFIYRYAKVAGGDLPNPFVDLKQGEFYYYPVLWAANNGITSGTNATHFTPSGDCTRAQVVTFLYRFNEKFK